MFWDDEAKPTEPLPAVGGLVRPASIPPAESLAEATLATRFGWDLRLFRGQRGADIYGGSGAYRLTGANALLRQQNHRLDVLRVVSFAKFGNAVRQLRNVFAVALAYGARRIEFPNPTPYFFGNRVGKFDLAWRLTRQAPGQPEAPGLDGRFYYLDALGLKPGPQEQEEIIRRYVRPLMAPELKQLHPEVRDDDIVLHFRGGDVFGATGTYIHREYGQPPVGFYLAAVEREKPSRVWLVYEDRANPGVDAVEAALRARGIAVIAQSGTLDADLRVLLSATRLVAGIGSFVPSVAALSTRAKRLYLFGGSIPTLQRLGITVIEGRDVRGDYRRAVRSGNWTASAEQRALMLSYPADALDFVEHAAST